MLREQIIVKSVRRVLQNRPRSLGMRPGRSARSTGFKYDFNRPPGCSKPPLTPFTSDLRFRHLLSRSPSFSATSSYYGSKTSLPVQIKYLAPQNPESRPLANYRGCIPKRPTDTTRPRRPARSRRFLSPQNDWTPVLSSDEAL